VGRGKRKNVKGEKDMPGEKAKAAESFENLHVYQRARELTNAVYSLTRQGAFAHDYGLADQIRRAAVSIMSNVAEGFERGTKTEFIQFLYIAKGSCGEVRAQLEIARDQDYVPASEYEHLCDLARRVSGMLSNFIAYLQKTDYQGEKFARPRRQAISAQKDRWAEMRAAQEVNIASQRRYEQERDGGRRDLEEQRQERECRKPEMEDQRRGCDGGENR
jgi:four helix bundle protein